MIFNPRINTNITISTMRPTWVCIAFSFSSN